MGGLCSLIGRRVYMLRVHEGFVVVDPNAKSFPNTKRFQYISTTQKSTTKASAEKIVFCFHPV